MDNAGNISAPQIDLNRPVPIESDHPKPVGPPANPTGGPSSVSRAPLNLGGPAKPVSAPLAPSAPPAPKAATPTSIIKKAASTIASSDRITGVKTFYTKLHPGAIEFLDDQIVAWLKENPGIAIKHTTVTTGEVQAKKTEANIIINIWY